MQFDVDPSEWHYAKELQFGRIVLKRAKRQLAKLHQEIQAASDSNRDTSSLEVEFHRLQEAITNFEREYETVQAWLADPYHSDKPFVQRETPS